MPASALTAHQWQMLAGTQMLLLLLLLLPTPPLNITLANACR